MRNPAFSPLNGGCLNLESAKQTKYRVASLLKILRNCRLVVQVADKTEKRVFRLDLQQIPRGMANLPKSRVLLSKSQSWLGN
jgi:hypothetical protein